MPHPPRTALTLLLALGLAVALASLSGCFYHRPYRSGYGGGPPVYYNPQPRYDHHRDHRRDDRPTPKPPPRQTRPDNRRSSNSPAKVQVPRDQPKPQPRREVRKPDRRQSQRKAPKDQERKRQDGDRRDRPRG